MVPFMTTLPRRFRHLRHAEPANDFVCRLCSGAGRTRWRPERPCWFCKGWRLISAARMNEVRRRLATGAIPGLSI